MKIAIVVLMLTNVSVFAQKPTPPRPMPDARPGMGMQQTTAYKGTLTDWMANDDFAYDGFYLETSSGKMAVKFPPHMGQQLTNAIKKGSDVTVNGVMNTSPEGESEVRMVSLTANGNTIFDTPPNRESTPPTEKFVNSEGTVKSLQTDKRGMLIGYILDNDMVLRIPRHNSSQLSNLANVGSKIQFTGTMHDAKDGQAFAKKMSVVHGQTLTVDGTQYLMR